MKNKVIQGLLNKYISAFPVRKKLKVYSFSFTGT